MITLLHDKFTELKSRWKNRAHNRDVRSYCTKMYMTAQLRDDLLQDRVDKYIHNVSQMCLLYGVVLVPLRVSIHDSIIFLEWETAKGTFTIYVTPYGGDTWRVTQGGTEDRLLARSGPMEDTYPYKVLLRLHR